MKKKEKTIYGLIGSILLLVLIVGTSYSYIKLTKEEKETNLLGTDCIKLEMEEESEAITLHHAYPVSDKVGQESTPYKFKLTNQCGVGVDYEVRLRVEEGSTIEASNIAASVDGATKVVLETQVETPSEPEKEEYKINTIELTLKPYEIVEHNVRIWLDENAGNESQNGVFKSKVVIEATQNQVAIYTEKLLNGADPVLYNTSEETGIVQTAVEEPIVIDTLVPVEIDEEGNVTKADVTTEWYSYEKQQWANAVILVDNEKAKTLKAGDKIQENEIESYFVWIPKYRYKLFDMGDYTSLTTENFTKQNQAIEIEFGIENTKDDESTSYKQCATPNKSGEDGECHVGDWMTHPAFTAFEGSKGMWVGKFETGYNQNTDNSLMDTTDWNEQNARQDKQDSTKVIIKPNVYSWRYISAGNAYYTSFNYERDLDSHMMKNTEWGAVAYLTHSNYGRCDKESSTCTEVTINSQADYLTGYTNNDISYFAGSFLASTTGNYSGIYDLNGGSWESVSSFILDTDNNPKYTSASGFTASTFPNNKKYYDVYNYSASYVDYKRRILGDATGEMGPFHVGPPSGYFVNDGISFWNDFASFLTINQVEFFRSGDNTIADYSGVFAFTSAIEHVGSEISFRIVLTPTNGVM